MVLVEYNHDKLLSELRGIDRKTSDHKKALHDGHLWRDRCPSFCWGAGMTEDMKRGLLQWRKALLPHVTRRGSALKKNSCGIFRIELSRREIETLVNVWMDDEIKFKVYSKYFPEAKKLGRKIFNIAKKAGVR